MGNSQNIEESVGRFIEKNALLVPGKKVLVAVSGGADSVTLLKMLLDMGYECEAIHCNFHLRGKESLRDEKFVMELCEQLEIKLHHRDFNTAQYGAQHGVSIEMAARELRYAYFEEVLKDTGAQAVAVGHHRDDNVETLMLNLVRGTGIRGVRGIQPRNGKIVRPLLCVSHDEILKYLDRKGMGYVTDSSNKLNVFSRNKIRLDVMPLLTSINLAASDNIAASIERLGEAYKVYEQAINAELERCVKTVGCTRIVDVNELNKCVSPRSVLHELLHPLGFSGSQEDDILRAMNGEPGRIFSAKQWKLLTDRSKLIIAPNIAESGAIEKKFRFASHEGTVIVDGCGTIHYQIMDAPMVEIKPEKRFAYLDVDKMHGPLTIRSIHQGDSFSPFGLKGKKLLSDFMTDLKFTRFEKESQKVMCDGNEIAWVIGERSSEKFRIDGKTKKVLVMEYIPQ